MAPSHRTRHGSLSGWARVLGADLDQLLEQAGQRPRLRGLRHHQAKGRRVAGDPNLKLKAPHGTDSSQIRTRGPTSRQTFHMGGARRQVVVRHVGHQKLHRRNHLLCGRIEAVREKWAMQIPVRWTVAMAVGVAYNICSLNAVKEARKHGIDSCRPDALLRNPSPREGQ